MNRRFTAANLDNIGFVLVADNAIEQKFHLLKRPMRLAVRPRLGITNWAFQITSIGHLEYRQTAMLFMIWTESAVVRATGPDRRDESVRHLAWLKRCPTDDNRRSHGRLTRLNGEYPFCHARAQRSAISLVGAWSRNSCRPTANSRSPSNGIPSRIPLTGPSRLTSVYRCGIATSNSTRPSEEGVNLFPTTEMLPTLT